MVMKTMYLELVFTLVVRISDKLGGGDSEVINVGIYGDMYCSNGEDGAVPVIWENTSMGFDSGDNDYGDENDEGDCFLKEKVTL